MHLPPTRPRRSYDYYELLGVFPDAPFRDIERAYWQAAQERRDLLPLLNQAYEALGDAMRRAEYDAQRRPSGTAARPRPSSPRPSAESKLQWFLH